MYLRIYKATLLELDEEALGVAAPRKYESIHGKKRMKMVHKIESDCRLLRERSFHIEGPHRKIHGVALEQS